MPDDAIDFSAIQRVLVAKLRHYGDVLLAPPVFAVLKNHVPHVEIDALVYADTQEMLSGHPALSHLHTIDRGWKKEGPWSLLSHEWRLLRRLRARHFDLLIHLTENPRGGWLAYLKQLAALAGQAKCFIGADSAPMHIAAAMQTPVVALFGLSGDLEWGPWMVKAHVVTSNHSCRPCGLDGCGQGKISECLTAITVEQVLAAVYQVLA